VRYVSPTGNDASDGSIGSPYLTIQRCASSVPTGGTCYVRAGTYPETITPNSGITIEAYNFETVTIDGTNPITGWSKYKGSVYSATVSLFPDDTNQIFVESNMMTEARWPNGNDLFNVNWAIAKAGTDDAHVVDSSLPAGDWTGAKIHLWSGTDPFSHQTGIVTSSQTGQIAININSTMPCPYICPMPGGRYYLFGTLNALDADSEWVYNASSGTLYFQAPGGVDPNSIDVRGKQRQYAFDLRGKSGVTIRNINIFACTVVTDDSSSNNTLDRINATYLSQFTDLTSNAPWQGEWGGGFNISNVHVADSGIILNGQGNTLENSTLSFSAGNGVALNGTNNTVQNNLIEKVDYVGDYGSGVFVAGNYNTIKHNTISNVGRIAIFLESALGQDVSYNNLFNEMQLSEDGGAIYACCMHAVGTELHHNWIHDTVSSYFKDGGGDAMSGIDVDNGSDGFEIDQNVLWNNARYNVLINGLTGTGPLNNYIHDNTIPDDLPYAYIFIAGVSNCAPTRIVDNRTTEDVDAHYFDDGCVVTNDNSAAPGATDMTPVAYVGCNFDGCASSEPPYFKSDDQVDPCPYTTVN
jgi:hypothetical protein